MTTTRREVWLVLDPDETPVRALSSEEEAVEVAAIESDAFLTYTVDGPYVREHTASNGQINADISSAAKEKENHDG